MRDQVGVDLPAEAFLLALVFQEEVCRRYRTAIPEWRSSRNEQQWDTSQREANEKLVIKEFTEALECVLPELGETAGDLARSLRTELNTILSSGTFGPVRLGYDYAPVDGGLRFFASMVRWINGDRIDLCRGVLTKEFDKAGLSAKPQRFFGFADYVSRLSYRARFLAALSVDEARQRDPARALQLERDILTVSERLVHGCVAEAVPLFWPRSSNLLRRQATELAGAGVSAQQIARNGVAATLDANIGPKAQALVSDISSYASRELDRLWSELRPRDVQNEETVEFLDKVEGWVGNVCQIMRSSPQSKTNHGNTKEVLQQFVGASELKARDLTIEMHRNDEDHENLIREQPVARLVTDRALEAYPDEWAGSLLRLEGTNPAMSLALIASPRQSPHGIQDALAELAKQTPTLTSVICVIWPWANASAFQERGFDDVTGSAGRKISCVCVTPLAYCALVTFVVRGFLPPTSLFRIADLAQGRLIGASSLVDEFSLLDHKDIPGSLRRDLLSHFEVL